MGPNRPKITVVIPALNEASVIGDCLAALRRQDYPQEAFEVIVVDNGSTDDTAAIARGHGATVLNEPRRSAYIARNTAIVRSSGEYLAFTDADCVADPAWLSCLATAAQAAPEVVASGLIVYEIAVRNIANKLLAEYRHPDILRRYVLDHHCVAAGNMFVSRSTFVKHGLFRLHSSGADTDFSRRVGSHGPAPLFVENAVVRHRCDLTNLEHLRRTFVERRGQALLQASPPSFARLFAAIGSMPWRPGVSYLRSGIAEWTYRWLDRWCAYAGHVHGEYLALRGTSYPIPSYFAFE